MNEAIAGQQDAAGHDPAGRIDDAQHRLQSLDELRN
jgi:hypothetical protein